jgi:hypothetical protein
MSRDLMHTAEINDLFRDAYHHVSLTAAVVAHKLYSDEEWRWFRSRRSTGRSA